MELGDRPVDSGREGALGDETHTEGGCDTFAAHAAALVVRTLVILIDPLVVILVVTLAVALAALDVRLAARIVGLSSTIARHGHLDNVCTNELNDLHGRYCRKDVLPVDPCDV